MAKKNARSLGCTWNKPYYLQPKEQELRIFIPHSYGMCQKWWSQRTHVLINDDFHPTHQLPDFSQFFGQKPHINFQTSLVFPKIFPKPMGGTSTFSLRLASPIASASTAAASAAAVALRSAARCADTAPSLGHCGSEPGRRRSGRVPGVHHGHHGFGWNCGEIWGKIWRISVSWCWFSWDIWKIELIERTKMLIFVGDLVETSRKGLVFDRTISWISPVKSPLLLSSSFQIQCWLGLGKFEAGHGWPLFSGFTTFHLAGFVWRTPKSHWLRKQCSPI